MKLNCDAAKTLSYRSIYQKVLFRTKNSEKVVYQFNIVLHLKNIKKIDLWPLKASWAHKPNPEDRINRKPKDLILYHTTKKKI